MNDFLLYMREIVVKRFSLYILITSFLRLEFLWRLTFSATELCPSTQQQTALQMKKVQLEMEESMQRIKQVQEGEEIKDSRGHSKPTCTSEFFKCPKMPPL